MKQVLLVTFAPMNRMRGRHVELLASSGLEVRRLDRDEPYTTDELVPLVGDVDAIIAGGERFDARLFAAAPSLKVLSRHGVGYDAVDVDAATRAGVVVTITPGANAVSVAELALGLMIALARRIPQRMSALLAGDWSRRPGIELAGKTLGLVGLGNIGRAVAVRASAFDMRVMAHDVAPDETFARAHGVELASFERVLREADIVSLHVPAIAGAPPIVGPDQFSAMKRNAFLLNTARGSLVDEDALLDALERKLIAGAALDVFANEPPGRHPLFGRDDVVLTPHIGGTIEAGERTATMAVRNALQVLRGERCASTVNPDVYEKRRR